MAFLVLWALMSAFVAGSEATWCVCKNDASSTALQMTIDYACGTGADCSAIHEKGGCYEPNTVLAHCSFAANSYFQRKGQVQGSCDFSGTGTVTNTDPSYTGCNYPATPSAAGTGTGTPTTAAPGTPTTVTPGIAPPTSTTGTPTTTMSPPTTTFTPGSTTNGVLGGGGGIGPSGTGTITTDGSGAGLHPTAGGCFSSVCAAILLSAVVLLRAW